MPDPANKDYTIFAGTEWSKVFTYATKNCPPPNTPINLTGYNAVLGAKVNQNDTVNALEISTAHGGIVLGGSAGTITCTFTPTQTAIIQNDSLFYSLYLIDPSANPLPPLLIGNLNFNRQTLPSGG